MEISQASLSGIPVLRVVGDVDHQAAAVFDEAVRGALGPDCDCLLLDLSDCPYLDSGGLGVILTVYRDMRERGWVGVVGRTADGTVVTDGQGSGELGGHPGDPAFGPNPNVRRLLELVGLFGAESFLVFGDEEEAASHVSAPRLDDYSASSN